MKKLVVLALITAFLSSIGLSQNILISFEDFKTAVSNVKIQGFTIITEDDYDDYDDDDYDEYYDDEYGDYVETEYAVAMLNNVGEVVIFTLYLKDGEPMWTDVPYDFEGVTAEYLEYREMKMFNADLVFINALLSIASTGSHGKSDLESFFKSTGLAKMKPETVNWIPEIPAQYRLNGTIISINISESDVDGYKAIVYVRAQVCNELNESYKKLRKNYGGGESFIRLPNEIIFDTPYGYVVEDLYTTNEDGDIILFIYYIP